MSHSTVFSLLKGLNVIEALNMHKAMNVNKVARVTGLTRGTAYRILETLRKAGYLRRDESSGTYWFERRILSLNDGFADEAWIWQVAKPLMDELGREIVWPLTISTPEGAFMLIRATTDQTSPLAPHHMMVGARMPILNASGGRAYLAHCDESQREILLDLAQSSAQELSAPGQRRLLVGMLASIRKQGYAQIDGINRTSTVSVPVMAKQRVIAALTARYFTSTYSAGDFVRRYLKRLQQTAAWIGRDFEKFQPGARKTAARQ